MYKGFVLLFVAFLVGDVVGQTNPGTGQLCDKGISDGQCNADGSECESGLAGGPTANGGSDTDDPSDAPTGWCCCHSSYCSSQFSVITTGPNSGFSFPICYACPSDPIGDCSRDGCSVGDCEASGYTGYATLDPHFLGLNGHKYDFQGEANKVFALISEPHVQVNARFVNASDIKGAKKDSTVMGEICVRYCDSTVTFDTKGTVTLSGPTSSNLIVNRRSNTSTTTEVTAGLWSLTVQLDKKHGDSHHHLHPFFNLKNVKLQHPVFAGPMHGVLGVTAPERRMPTLRSRNSTLTTPAKDKKAHPHCQAKNEGGCEVPGEWHEYEVKNNDLCGTDFKYSKFDNKKCSSIAANLKRGVAEVNLLQRAQQSILL